MASVALQSKDHRDLLDIIDKLRSRGIRRYVDLPEIIVCGDQSAGKSSVLEAISGMSFPTKDNLCTRFATELILRRDATSGVKVSISPGPEASADDRERLSRFHHDIEIEDPNIGPVIEKAKEAMGLSDTKVFSTDTLRIELCGPRQAHLTLVDLPGLFRAGNREQSVTDAATVHSLVRGYMKRPRSIILTVVSAKSDFTLQEVTEMARTLDPKGMRTLGLITKPDTLDAGSDSEASYLNLARNRDVVFRLGWHVLKNRNYEMRSASSAERDADEARFFSAGAWANLDPKHVGVKALVTRLSTVLKDQILRQLPSFLVDVRSGIVESERRLAHLGTARGTFDERRGYLVQVSLRFSMLMKAAVDGIYNDAFFGDAMSDEGFKKRLRAVVQHRLAAFAQEMRSRGHIHTIIDDPPVDKVLTRGEISRSDYIDRVKNLMERSRGCELPGTFNSLIVSELFKSQCQKWRQIAIESKEDIVQAVYSVAQAILHHVAADETVEGILQYVSGSIRDLTDDRDGLNETVIKLLNPHYSGHPITNNHYLVEAVQKAQATRRRRELEQKLKESYGIDQNGNLTNNAQYIAPLEILHLLETQTENDMQRYASNMAVDYMQAYYKVSISFGPKAGSAVKMDVPRD